MGNPTTYTDQEGDLPTVLIGAGTGAAISGAYAIGVNGKPSVP